MRRWRPAPARSASISATRWGAECSAAPDGPATLTIRHGLLARRAALCPCGRVADGEGAGFALWSQARQLVEGIEVLRRSQVVDYRRPERALWQLWAIANWGPYADATAAGARFTPNTPALIDESRTLNYAEADRRSNALARAWRADGLGEHTALALLCRDHRAVLDTLTAAGKIGAQALPLNPGSTTDDIAQILEREQLTALVHDPEFAARTARLPAHLLRYQADDRLERLIAEGDTTPVPVPHPPHTDPRPAVG